MIRRGIKRPTRTEWEEVTSLLQSKDLEVRLLGATILKGFSVSNSILRLCYKIAREHCSNPSPKFTILNNYINSTTNES